MGKIARQAASRLRENRLERRRFLPWLWPLAILAGLGTQPATLAQPVQASGSPALAPPNQPQPVTAPNKAEAFLARLRQAYAGRSVLRMDFSQSARLGWATRHATGVLWLDLHGMLRMEYTDPSRYAIKTDGVDAWRERLDPDDDGIRLAHMARWPAWFPLRNLLDLGYLLQEYEYTIPDNSKLGTPDDIVLSFTAHYPSTTFPHVEVAFSAATLQPRQLEYVDRGGFIEHYVFSNLSFDCPEAKAPKFFREAPGKTLPAAHASKRPGKQSVYQPVSWSTVSRRFERSSLSRLIVSPLGTVCAAAYAGLIQIATDGSWEYLSRRSVLDVATTDGGLAVASADGLAWHDKNAISSPRFIYYKSRVSALAVQSSRLWFLTVERNQSPVLGSIALDESGRPIGSPELKQAPPRVRSLRTGPGRLLLVQQLSREWSAYDPQSGQLLKLPFAQDDEVFDAANTAVGVFILHNKGLSWIDSSLRVTKLDVDTGDGEGVLGLSNDGYRLLIGRWPALHELDLSSLKVRRTFVLPGANNRKQQTLLPTAVAQDWQGRLWVGTSEGLYITDPDEKRSKVLTFTLNDEDAAIQMSKEHLSDLFGSLREIKASFVRDAPQGRFSPINAGFAANGSLWLSGADRLVLQKDANSETPSFTLKTLSPVTSASVIREPIVAGSFGLLQLKRSGNVQLLPPAHGSAHELLDASTQQRSLLTRTLLSMPPVQELVFNTFSFSHLRNIDKDDNLLTMAENRFGRSHMSAWPWFSYQLLSASADEVLVRTVPKAGSESPLTLIRTDSDAAHFAVLPNTLPKTKLAQLIQEPASGDWIVQTESGHLYRSPRSLGGFREITLPQDIDDRGVGELQLLVGADSTAQALLRSQSRLWIRRDGKWLSLPADGEPPSTQPAQSDIPLMSRITADGSQRAIQQLYYGKLNQQRLTAALGQLPGTSAPTPGPTLQMGKGVPVRVADSLLSAANRIRRALGVAGELGPILGHVSDGADELVLTQHGLVRLGQKADQAERVELVDWPNEVTEKGTLLVRLPSGHILVAAGEPAAGRSRLWSHRVRGEPFVSLPTAPSWVLSVNEQPDGSLLLGVYGGRAIRLTSRGQIEPGPRILPRGPYERPLGPYFGVCPLRGQRALIVPYTLDAAIVSADDSTPVWTKQDVRPFQNCVDLGEDRYMLHHWDHRLSVFDDKTQTVKDLDFTPKAVTSAAAALLRSQDNDPNTSHPTVVLVVDGALHRFNFGSQRFERLGALPRRSLASPNILAVERDAVWSASAGLWRIPLPKAPSKETLIAQLWDEQDGLPTLALTGIHIGGSGLNKGEILITHPGGLSRLRPEGDHFLSESLSGSLPTADRIQAASLFSIKGHRVLVLVTADGIHLATYNAQTTDLSVGATWKYRSANVAQSPESPLALAHLPASSELVLASDAGVRTYKVDVVTQDGAVTPVLTESSFFAPSLALRQAGALQLVSSQDGSQLYMLVKIPQSDSAWMPQSNYRLLRFARSDGWQLDKSDGDSGSLLLENAQRAWLGPSVAGAAPQVLVEDSNDQFVLFRMSQYKVPKLLVEQGIFGITAQVLPNTLDPKDATAQHWRASFRLNELPEGKPAEHDLFHRYLLKGLLTEQRGTVFVRLVFDDLEPYVLSQIIPAYQGFAVRRVVILSLLTLWCVLMIGYLLVRLRRNRRLAARFMPYVQGGAIRDPEQFFGRQSLLATLCSHIAVANYALVGDFRIGKSSIQHQLTRRLTELNQQTYRYFPFYVDLERLNDIQGSDFFYLLGHGLCELLAKNGVPEHSIRALKASNAEDPTAYNTRHFQRDLQCALDALAPQSAPRQPMIVIQIDEIALVENFQPMLLINFRGVFQNQPHVRTILTGRHLPQDGEEFRQSPWWNFLREEIVGPLSPKEARELITMPTRGYFQVSPAAIDRVLSITGGRPQQIQRLCADLLTYKYTQGTRKWRATPITLDDVEAVLQEQERSLSKPGVQP